MYSIQTMDQLCLDILVDPDRLPLAQVDLVSHSQLLHSSFSLVSGCHSHKLLNMDSNLPTHQNALDMPIDDIPDSHAIYHSNSKSNGMLFLQVLVQGIAWFWSEFHHYK